MPLCPQQCLDDDLAPVGDHVCGRFVVDTCKPDVQRRRLSEVAPPRLAVGASDPDLEGRVVEGVPRDQSVATSGPSSDVLDDSQATPQPSPRAATEQADEDGVGNDIRHEERGTGADR